MKKIGFLLLTTLLITGCNYISITKEEHTPGLDNSSYDGIIGRDNNVSYFNGDTFDRESAIAHEITFKETEDNVEFTMDKVQNFKDIIIDNDNIVSDVLNLKEVASFRNSEKVQGVSSGVRVGYPSDVIDGKLSLKFNISYKSCDIFAYPRYGLSYVEEGTKELIDELPAISANGSRYIKVNNENGEIADEISNIQSKTCSYNFAIEKDTLDLVVFGSRAIIYKIILYC